MSDTVANKVLLAEFDGESVLLNAQTGHYFEINDSGLLIWKLAAEHRSHDEIVDELERTFEISRSQASRDVSDFLDSLKDRQLLAR